MSDVYLQSPTYALGEEAFSVEASAAAGRTLTGAAQLREQGFAQHWMAAPLTTAYELALRATEPMRPQLGRVGALIYATCLPQSGSCGRAQDYEASRDVKHLLEYPASHLQAALGLTPVPVLGLNQQACTSALGMVRVARGLLAAEADLEDVLCVSADRFPPGALYEQAYNLISDGACAFLISRRPGGFKVLSTAAMSNGAMARASDEETVGSYFNYMHQTITQALAAAHLKAEDLSWVVPQNTSPKAWQILASLLRLPAARVFAPSQAEVGHVISADPVVNLAALVKDPALKPGQKLLLCMAGYGLNWQATILERV